jgi:hypothetical protein
MQRLARPVVLLKGAEHDRAELKTSFLGLVGEASARPGCIPGLS